MFCDSRSGGWTIYLVLGFHQDLQQLYSIAFVECTDSKILSQNYILQMQSNTNVANLDGTEVNSSTARSRITEHMIKTCFMWLKIDVISADIL